MTAKINIEELVIENFNRVDHKYQNMLAVMAMIIMGVPAKKIPIDLAANMLCMIPKIAGEDVMTAMNDARRLVEIFSERVEALENRAN